MKELIIKTASAQSKILVGESIANLHKYLVKRKIVIVSDINLGKLYGKYFPEAPVILIPVGEKNKNINTVLNVINDFVSLGVDRNWFVLGIGGGVVCDIAGFVASIYMRGMKFGFVSTSLLSQVDASVGGKNGVNFLDYKNMIGTINQPEFVLCDTNMLKTLPQKELSCGYAEIIKHGIISGNDYFVKILANKDNAFQLKKDVIEDLVWDSVKLKASIVESDEKEAGLRKNLNFGHSFGHAIEINSTMSHGESVSVGMYISAKISKELGFTGEKEVEAVRNILEAYKLPIKTDVSSITLFNSLKKDKKKHSDEIHFVFLRKIGEVFTQPISFDKLESLYLKIFV